MSSRLPTLMRCLADLHEIIPTDEFPAGVRKFPAPREKVPCADRGRTKRLRFALIQNAKAPDEPGPSTVMPNLISACGDAACDAAREHRPTAVPGLPVRPTH